MRGVRRLAALLCVFAMGAGPSGWSPGPGMDFGTPASRPTPLQQSIPGYTSAPTPDQDADAPHARASNETSVSPSLFSRSDQYRGQAISPDSSSQSQEERRVKPGAGISLHMPLQ